MNPKQLGNFGENIACYYLKNKGYKILDKNYSRKWIQGPQKGEIDIVAKKDDVIYFIEVKTLTESDREQPSVISPEEKVNFQKQKQLIKITQDWLSEKKIPLESKWQIDVVAIKIDLKSKKAKIRHIQNAIGA
ncbi:MAG: YraN family protein [Candidatus Nealsonbacteria bacterium]